MATMYKIFFKNGQAFDSEDNNPLTSLAPYLNSEIELDENTTFEHVWNYLEKDVEFFDTVFFDALGKHPLKDYIEQSKNARSEEKDEDPTDSMKFLELRWSTDIIDDETGEIFIGTDFGGVGPHEYNDGSGKIIRDEDCSYAVEFTPVQDLLAYPLKLDKEFIIQKYDHKSPNGVKIIFKGVRKFTVYDLFHGILWEISFLGSPENQLQEIAGLDQNLAEAKDAVKEGLIEKFKTLDEWKEEDENGEKMP